MTYRVRHKENGSEGRLVRTDGRLALVKWDNQSPALLIEAEKLECIPMQPPEQIGASDMTEIRFSTTKEHIVQLCDYHFRTQEPLDVNINTSVIKQACRGWFVSAISTDLITMITSITLNEFRAVPYEVWT